MMKEYGWDIPEVHDIHLSEEAERYIGRIVRSFAEIEVCVGIIIIMQAGIHERHYDYSLGTAGLRRKLEIVENFARFCSNEAHAFYKSVFTHHFFNALSLRNFLAHGAYLGKADSGEYVFLANTTVVDSHYSEAEGRAAIVSPVLGVTEESLQHHSESLSRFIRRLIDQYNIEPLLRKYLRSTLVRHKKAKRKGPKTKEPRDPPQSSQT